ncbi:MAG: ABC transporter permease [Eubacteriales bacterium]
MRAFCKRNLLVFFRDRLAIFFSLLSTFIIIGLYVLFLGDVWTSGFSEFGNMREVMDNWIMAGLLAVTSVTTTMGAFGVMIGDRSQKIMKDLYCSPISRTKLTGGYVLSAFLIGMCLTGVTLVLAQLYIVLYGGSWLSLTALVQVAGIVTLTTFSNTALVFFAVSFISSESAFSTMSTVIGTLIGFVTGIYLPIGSLPDAVQWVVKCFPPSHGAALLRRVMMAEPLERVAIPEEALPAIKETLGVEFYFGEQAMGVWPSLLILLCSGVLFFGLSIWSVNRKKKA